MPKQNPYLNARLEWDERYGGLISRARNWQLMAAGSLAVAVVAVVGIAYVGSQSKIQPFVVVTDQLGSPVAVARPAAQATAGHSRSSKAADAVPTRSSIGRCCGPCRLSACRSTHSSPRA